MTKSENHKMIKKLRNILGGKEVSYNPEGNVSYNPERDPVCFRLRIAEYTNHNLFIGLVVDGVQYTNITANLSIKLPWYEFYVDANNFPEAIDLLFENNIARYTGKMMQSGFCHYPLFALVPEIIKEVEK